MSGIRYHYCSACLRQHPFYGVLDGDALSGLGLLREVLRVTFFKPVCAECGTRLNWWGDEYFLGRDNRNYDFGDGQDTASPRLAVALNRLEMSDASLVSDISKAIVERSNSSKAKPFLSDCIVEWSDIAFSCTGRLRASDGQLLAKIQTHIHYMLYYRIMRGNDAMIALRSSAAVGHYENWIEIFAYSGWCVFPFGLPKWRAVASIPMAASTRDILFDNFERRNAIVVVSSEDLAYIDADKPTASVILSYADMFGYCRLNLSIEKVYICLDENFLILTFYDWQQADRRRAFGLMAVDVENKSKPLDLGVALGPDCILDEKVGFLLVCSGNNAFLYRVGDWQNPLSVTSEAEIIAGQFSIDGNQIFLKTSRGINDSGRFEGIAYEGWEIVFVS